MLGRSAVPRSVGVGPSGLKLDFRSKERDRPEMLAEAANLIANIGRGKGAERLPRKRRCDPVVSGRAVVPTPSALLPQSSHA